MASCARVPERLERLQPRVESEEAVEIDRGVFADARPGDRDARPRAVVLGFAERHDHAQAVHGAALKDRDELLARARPSLRERRAREERRREPEAHQRERAVLQEDSVVKSWLSPPAV